MMKKNQWVFVDKNGELRLGWRLAMGIFAYSLAFYGVLWGLGAIFGALFEVWNLTNENLIYAPGWAQQIVLWHTDFTYALAYAASVAVALWITRRRKKTGSFKMIMPAAMMGAGMGAALTLTAFALDSMRLEAPLSEPSLSVYHLSSLIVLLLGSLSAEALTKRLVFDPVRKRFGRVWGYAIVSVMAVILSGMWTRPVALLNAFLMGIIGCVLYERGGLFASAALSAGWSAWTTWLFAWPGTGTGVYGMYTISDAWLTGGNAGADCGILATIGWIMIAALLLRRDFAAGIAGGYKRRQTNGKDSHCNRRSGLQR